MCFSPLYWEKENGISRYDQYESTCGKPILEKWWALRQFSNTSNTLYESMKEDTLLYYTYMNISNEGYINAVTNMWLMLTPAMEYADALLGNNGIMSQTNCSYNLI